MPLPLTSLCGCQSASRLRAHRNVAVVSHAQYVLTVTAAPASHVKATLKVVSESRVTWATSMPILVFLGLSCSRVRPDVCDRDRRQTDVRQKHCLMPLPIRGWGIITVLPFMTKSIQDVLFSAADKWHKWEGSCQLQWARTAIISHKKYEPVG